MYTNPPWFVKRKYYSNIFVQLVKINGHKCLHSNCVWVILTSIANNLGGHILFGNVHEPAHYSKFFQIIKLHAHTVNCIWIHLDLEVGILDIFLVNFVYINTLGIRKVWTMSLSGKFGQFLYIYIYEGPHIVHLLDNFHFWIYITFFKDS